MAGQFEIFRDADLNIRFRLLGADGTVLAISKAFEDKRSAAEGISAVRECAGTGLVVRVPSKPRGETRRAAKRSPVPGRRQPRNSAAVPALP